MPSKIKRKWRRPEDRGLSFDEDARRRKADLDADKAFQVAMLDAGYVRRTVGPKAFDQLPQRLAPDRNDLLKSSLE